MQNSPEQIATESPSSGEGAALKNNNEAAGSSIDFSNKSHTDKVLKELPMADFLNLLESSSAEELELMLRNAELVEAKPRTRSTLPSRINWFFGLDRPRENGALATFLWWEGRRAQYNIVVGACGLATLFVLHLCGFGAPLSAMTIAALFYGGMANLCYSTGWVSDLLARHFGKEKAEHFGAILYCQGLAFSMALTTIPAALAIFFHLIGVR